ncbi:Gfo/Idh/MocA family protein [Oceanobacillus sp. Castelsardo]|uniref:Gfo/Idh/MocA family protein n=1 Tax=Oceanobacillus sp. Castelsardo TaxID=1851204 RepID=UPI0009EF096B|nr:Gfo/Idh/MocA family oxidoreductase [Oceanobacillus sp. Castelsardo]
MISYSTIGTSWITESFIEAVNLTGKAVLSSVYSRTEESSRSFAAKNGVERWYTELDEMLKEDTNFVYIASPNTVHFEQIIKVLKAKKHVFCEKPMVITEEELQIISDLAEQENVFVFEGYRHLYSPNYEIFKKTIEKVGALRSCILHFNQYSSRYDALKEGKESNVFSKEFAGGALTDLGVYPLSMAIDMFGEPSNLDYYPVMLGNGVDGSGTLVLDYKSFIVTILCSKITQAIIPSEIQGEEGTITIDHIAPISKISHYDRKNKQINELAVEQAEQDMVYEAEEFIQMISENDDTMYKQAMERSKKVVKVLEAARLKLD